MAVWFRGLSPTGKSLSVLGAVFVAGLTVAVAMGGWFGLPAQVEVNTTAITKNTGEIRGVSQKMDQMICLQLLNGGNPQSCL